MANIAVLGAGSWGTALALQLARNQHDVTLWAHRREHAAALAENRENRRYLPGIPLPPNLAISDDLAASVRAAELVLAVVPSRAFAGLLADLKPHIQQTPLMWAIKGFEAGSGRLLTDVFMETLGEHPHAILAGPSFAKEVAAGQPTAVTLAARDDALAQTFARYFHGSNFLCYTSTDLTGIQIGGAVKNVIAIATGIADGLGCGAQEETLTGLAGMGDLVLTCTDDQSRNRRFGLALGRGESAAAAKAAIGQVVEGEGATHDTYALAQQHGIRMPITEHLHHMLAGSRSLEDTFASLLARNIKQERH